MFAKRATVGKKEDILEIVRPFVEERSRTLNLISRISVEHKAAVDHILPASNKELKKLSAEGLGSIIAQISPMLEEAADGTTCTKTWDDRLKALDCCYQKAYDAAYKLNMGEMKGHFGTVPIKLQRKRYLGTGMCLPVDEEHRFCMCCGCKSIHEPDDNIAKSLENVKMQKEHSKRMREVKAGKKVAAKRSGDSVITRAPPPPTLHDILMICSCRGAKCSRKGTDAQSTCPTRCINPATGKRYEWDDAKGGCQCPRCRCECSVGYKVCEDFCNVFIIIYVASLLNSLLHLFATSFFDS